MKELMCWIQGINEKVCDDPVLRRAMMENTHQKPSQRPLSCVMVLQYQALYIT